MKNLYAVSEIELLHRLKQGDEQALRSIFERYWDKLLAYAIHRLKNEQEAQEAVQDLFIKLWSIRENLDIQVSLGAYLSRAITNTVYDRLDKLYRASQKYQQLLAAAEEPLSAPVDTLIFERELQDEISKAINILPQKCRVVFVKSRLDGLSNAEIAEQLSLSQRTVETHISNALKLMRRNLSGSSLLLLIIDNDAMLSNIKALISHR